MKLYEILLRKVGWSKNKEPEIESTVYNPLCCKIGSVIKIDNLEYRDYRFTVKSIREYCVLNTKMTDYILQARPVGQEDITVIMRVVPNSGSRLEHRVAILHLHDELQYDEGFYEMLKSVEIFEMNDESDPNNRIVEQFSRVNDVRLTYSASVTDVSSQVVMDQGNYKEKVGSSETSVEFWDFSRNTNIEGVNAEEFVYVEMNKDDGMFQIWRGFEVIPERVEVF